MSSGQKTPTNTSLERVCAFADLKDGRMRLAKAGSIRLAISRIGSDVYAVSARCTHADIYLASGRLVDTCKIECPMHGAQFSCKDGTVKLGPATEPLTTFDVKIIDDDVYVDIGPQERAETGEKPDDKPNAPSASQWGSWGAKT